MAKKQIDTRSDRKKAKDAAYAALPPLKIVKPLRYLRNETSVVEIDPDTQRPRVVLSQLYKDAKEFAKKGQGAVVQAMAMFHHDRLRAA